MQALSSVQSFLDTLCVPEAGTERDREQNAFAKHAIKRDATRRVDDDAVQQENK